MTVLAVAAAAYVAWAALLFGGQRRLVFPGQALRQGAPQRAPAGSVVTHRVPVPGGEVDVWFIPPPEGSAAPVLVFTHGNAELITDWVGLMTSFARRGVGVLLVEFPGYGGSTGSPSAASLRGAALGAYDWISERPEVDPHRIIAYGRSVGGGPAAQLSLERPLAGLVLQSSFTSLRPFAARFLLPSFLIRDRFEVLDAVREFQGPVLVIHGRDDEVIPFSHGEALASAGRDVEFIQYECAHNDCPPDWEAHVDRVVAFLHEKGVLI